MNKIFRMFLPVVCVGLVGSNTFAADTTLNTSNRTLGSRYSQQTTSKNNRVQDSRSSSPGNSYAANSSRIMMTAWCDGCKELENFLYANNIPFRYDYVRRDEKYSKMGVALPVVGTKVIRIPVKDSGWHRNQIGSKNIRSEPMCDVIAELIKNEKRAGGCIINSNL